MTQINLRGHHLLCVFGWQGHGYDERFTQKMDEVAALIAIPPTLLSVADKTDGICQSCPHLKEDGCFKDKVEREEEIQAQDERVLDFLGLKRGQTFSVNSLKQLISQKKPHLKLDELCAGCSWLGEGYCYKGLEQQGHSF